MPNSLFTLILYFLSDMQTSFLLLICFLHGGGATGFVAEVEFTNAEAHNEFYSDYSEL